MKTKNLFMNENGSVSPVVRAKEEKEEEQKEKLSGLARLEALGSEIKSITETATPSAHGNAQNLTGLDRLNALGAQSNEEETAIRRVIDRSDAGTDWGALGRFRPSGATEGYTAAAWNTDDPEELERQMGDLTGRLETMGSRMTEAAAPVEKYQPYRNRQIETLDAMGTQLNEARYGMEDIERRMSLEQQNIDAIGLRLDTLRATANDANASWQDRFDASQSYQAMLQSYNRAVEAQTALRQQYGQAYEQYGTLRAQYEKAYADYSAGEAVFQSNLEALRRQADEYERTRKELGNTVKQYTAVSSAGDEQAVKLLEEADEWRRKAEYANQQGRSQWALEYQRKAEKAEEEAAQAQQRYGQYLLTTRGEEAANAYLGENPLARRERERQESLSFAQKVLNTVGGTAANFFSGYAGSPLITLARIMEMPDDLLYDITGNEIFNQDRHGMRNSEALEAADSFRETANELGQSAGWLGQQIINTGYAAGQMLSSHAIAGAALGSLNTAQLTNTLEGIANSNPLVTSRAARLGANLGLSVVRDVVRNPGNIGVSFGAGVRGYSEALKKGDNFGQALTVGLEKAALEYFSNKLFSGTPFEDSPEAKGYVTQIVEKIAGKLGKSDALKAFNETTGGKVLNWFLDKAGEGMEEVVSAIGEPIIDWANEYDLVGAIRRGEQIRLPEFPKVDELLDEFVGGVLLSLLMTGGEETVKAITQGAADAKAAQAVIRDLEGKGIDGKAAAKYAKQIVKTLRAVQKAEDTVREAAKQAGTEARPAAENTVITAGREENRGSKAAANAAPVITAGRETAQTANRGTENTPIDVGTRVAEDDTGGSGQAETQGQAGTRTEASAAAQSEALRSAVDTLRSGGELDRETLRRVLADDAAIDTLAKAGVLDTAELFGLTKAYWSERDQEAVLRQAVEQYAQQYAQQAGEGLTGARNEDRLALPLPAEAAAEREATPVITAGTRVAETRETERTEERNEPRISAADIGGPGAELLDGDRGREPGERTGAEPGRVGAEPKNWRALTQPQKAAERQNRGRGIRAEKVSGRDLGIRGASEEKTVTIYTESEWDDELRDIDRVAFKVTGRHVTFVLGSIPVPGTASGKVRGVNVGGRIIIQVDNLSASATQLFLHEMYHTWARADPGLTERVKRKIIETYSREEFEAIVDKYLEKKAGALDLSRLDEEAMERLTDKCVEEVCADAYAGINWFGTNAGKYRAEAAEAVREGMQGGRETAAATERRTGPPEDYSEAERDEEYMAAVEAGDMETAQRLVDEAAKKAGYKIHAYHGTGRADRVGTVFRPDRATSGPMAFFTDNKEIAEHYSHDKRDTSIAYDTDYDSYEEQFRAKHTLTGKDYAIYKMWGFIPMADRTRIKERAKHVRIDYDGDGDIIYDPNANEANGGWSWQVKEFGGNVLKALNEQWLNSGNLFNEEEQYLRVLELAGVTAALRNAGFELPRYMNPDYREEGVYDVYLKIRRPFDATKKVTEDFIRGFEEYAEDNEDQFTRESMDADYWDKNSVSAEQFAERMREDLENGTTRAWTSIPDVMTAYLKSLKYDGIKDSGGKNGGVSHTVWIPFTSQQIKSSAAVTHDERGDVIPLSERFNPKEEDIRFSEEDEPEYTKEDLPALKAEYREISDLAHRSRLKELDREKFNENEARRKELRRIIARLGTVEPNLTAARADLEQRESLEYQQELLAQGGIKALRENEKKIKELRKKIGKLEKIAGTAEGTEAPSSVGEADTFPQGKADAAAGRGTGGGSSVGEVDTFPQGKAETEIPQSAAEYARRKEAGTLPEAERIRELEQEIAARKDPARQAQLLYEKGAEAVAREVREVQKLQAELRELRRPKLPTAQRAQTDNESIPQSAAEYARRKAEGTLPRSLSEETRARIEEIKRDLKERDSQEHKDAIYREKGAEALAAEVNAIKRLKGELNRLEQGDRLKAKPPKSKITWAKRDLADSLMRAFSVPSYESKSVRGLIEAAAERILKNGELSFQEENALFDRLWNAGEAVWQGEEGKEVYRFLRNTRVFVPAGVKEEFGDSWRDFRNKAFTLGVYLTNNENDQGWDSVNMELAEAFPGLFNADELDARAALERIVQLAEEGQGEKMTLGEYAAKVAGVNWASQEELESNLRRKLDWALQTFAKQAQVEQYYKDKMGEKITREREAAAQRQDEAVRRERERGDRRVQEAQNKGRAMLETERAREALRRGKEKEARRAAEQRKKEIAVLKETQQKTLQQLQWLSRNQNKFPEEARARVKELLEDIDIYAISAADEMHIDNATGRTWRDLADTYKEAREKDPNWLPSADLERIVARLDNKKIGQMDIDALRTLYQAAVQLRTELYNRNNLINDMLHREFSEVYSQVKQELENAPEPKTGAAQKYAEWQLHPMNRFLQMAGWDKESQWYQMGQMLEQGERDAQRFITRAQNMVGQFLRDNQDWVRRADGQGKDAIWYEIEVPELLELGMGDKPIFGGSKKVWMTPAQKVELYLESKGYDNLRHMTGGRTFPDKELYSKGERKAALEKGTTIRLAPESVKNIVKDLTPEEMALANLLEQFYNQFSKAEINRVSNLLYGYDKAMEAYYAPIFTNDNYTKSEPGVFDLTAEGVGNLKERQVSSVPSLNLSAFDAFERSVDKTAKFVGLAIPIRNMNTLWNWTGEKTSTKEIVSKKWPVQGKNFVEDLMTELQNGRNAQNGKLDELVNQALNKYINSVFAANASVVLKQFGSYPLAASYLGWENLTLRWRKAAQVDTDLISAYTGVLDYRLLGYATPETAALKNNPGILQRKGPLNFLFGGGAITWMDGFTVRTLWTAAENKVSREQPDLERGTEEQIRAGQSEYYQAVAKEFEEAVSRSQPMYDTMHRSDIMRKQGALTRAFTLFKTVPQQEFNMLMESFGEVQAAHRSGDAERIKAAKGKMGRTVSGILVGNLMIGIITFLNALWKNKGKKYRDEEGDLNVWSIMEQFGKQFFVDTLGLGLGGDLAADQIAAVFWDDKLYDIESPGMEQVNDIYQRITAATKKAWTLAKDSVDVLIHGGNWLKYLNMHGDEYVSAVEDVARMLGTYGAGLPMDNVKSYLLGAMRWASPKIATAYEDVMSKADRSGLKGLTGGALDLRMEHILQDRIGSADDETVYILSRLYEAGIRDAAPPDMPSKVTVDGEERKLNLVQEQTYASAYQLTVGRSLNELVRSKGFRAADAEARGKMLKALYDYGREEAKAAVWPDYEPETEKAESFMKAGMTLAQWAEYKVETAGRKKEDILDYIDGMDLTRDEKDAVYYAQGYAESKIDETPWHRGGRRGSGNTWAKADQSWLMLPAMPQASRSSGPVLPSA